jgi:hypothetical protein
MATTIAGTEGMRRVVLQIMECLVRKTSSDVPTNSAVLTTFLNAITGMTAVTTVMKRTAVSILER